MCGTAEEFLASVLNWLSRWPFSARAVYLACLSRKGNRNGQKLEKSHDRLPSLWVSLGSSLGCQCRFTSWPRPRVDLCELRIRKCAPPRSLPSSERKTSENLPLRAGPRGPGRFRIKCLPSRRLELSKPLGVSRSILHSAARVSRCSSGPTTILHGVTQLEHLKGP